MFGMKTESFIVPDVSGKLDLLDLVAYLEKSPFILKYDYSFRNMGDEAPGIVDYKKHPLDMVVTAYKTPTDFVRRHIDRMYK